MGGDYDSSAGVATAAFLSVYVFYVFVRFSVLCAGRHINATKVVKTIRRCAVRHFLFYVVLSVVHDSASDARLYLAICDS